MPLVFPPPPQKFRFVGKEIRVEQKTELTLALMGSHLPKTNLKDIHFLMGMIEHNVYPIVHVPPQMSCMGE